MPVLKELFDKSLVLATKSDAVKVFAKSVKGLIGNVPLVPDKAKPDASDVINHADTSKPKPKPNKRKEGTGNTPRTPSTAKGKTRKKNSDDVVLTANQYAYYVRYLQEKNKGNSS